MIQTSFQKSIVFFGMEGFYAGIQENPAIFSSISPVFSSVCVCVCFNHQNTEKTVGSFSGFSRRGWFSRDPFDFRVEAMRPSPTFNSIIDAVLAASGFWVRTDGRCKIDVIFAEGSPLWGGWWQENQCVFFDIYCILLYYPIFWGDMISHCKDPYEPISINGTAVLLVFQVVCWTWTCQVKKIHVIPYEGMMMFFLHRWSHLFIRYRCNYIYIYT